MQEKETRKLVPQQRKLMGSSAQISSGVRRCGLQAQVPEGSGGFRKVPLRVLVQVPEAGSGGFWKVLEGSRKFRNVGGGGRCKGSGRFGELPEGSGGFRRAKGQTQVLEGFC